MALMSHRQKVLLGDREPVVLLRGTRGGGVPFFAYVVLSMEQLTRLNRDMERGILVSLADYGRIVVQGEGEPTEAQKEYMERHYAFDHYDPFDDDEDDTRHYESAFPTHAAA